MYVLIQWNLKYMKVPPLIHANIHTCVHTKIASRMLGFLNPVFFLESASIFFWCPTPPKSKVPSRKNMCVENKCTK